MSFGNVRALTTGVAIALTLSCAKQPQTAGAEAPSGEAAGEEKPSGASDVPWEQKNHQQRLEYMGLVVYPKMKELFQAYDPEYFGEFKCQTCHGEDMEAVDYEMPNSLIALSAENTIEEAMSYDPETSKFMAEKVVPKMAELLGEDPVDPQEGSGFGCFACHQKE